MILTTVNLKGGMCRTTATFMLAQAYQQLGYNVGVLDLTSLGDCASFAKIFNEEGHPITFTIDAMPIDPENRSATAVDLKERIEALHGELGENGLLLVDTASHDSQIIEDVVALSDITLVPTDASFAAERPTLETIKRTTAPSVVLISNWDEPVTDGVREATVQAEGKVLDTVIHCAPDFIEDFDSLKPQYLALAKELVAA